MEWYCGILSENQHHAHFPFLMVLYRDAYRLWISVFCELTVDLNTCIRDCPPIMTSFCLIVLIVTVLPNLGSSVFYLKPISKCLTDYLR